MFHIIKLYIIRVTASASNFNIEKKNYPYFLYRRKRFLLYERKQKAGGFLFLKPLVLNLIYCRKDVGRATIYLLALNGRKYSPLNSPTSYNDRAPMNRKKPQYRTLQRDNDQDY